MKKFPLVSICIATYSRPDLFRSSLLAILAQNYPHLEILILVDGSNPNSIKICNEIDDDRINMYTTEKASGMVGAWNFICSKAKGKYILFCADDDILMNDAVTKHVEILEENKNIEFVHSNFYFIDDNSKIIGASITKNYFLNSKRAFKRFVLKTSACMQTVIFRKKSWLKVGKWKSLGNPTDNYLYLKLIEMGGVYHLNTITCKYRIRTNVPDPPKKKIINHLEFYNISSEALKKTTLLNVYEKKLFKFFLKFRTIKNLARVYNENINFDMSDVSKSINLNNFKFIAFSKKSLIRNIIFRNIICVNDFIFNYIVKLKNYYHKT
jgi:glycosyltransferase involved in cell wall biosynthesis